MKRTFITLVFLVLLSGPFMAGAVTYYTRVSGNWNALTTWSTVACGGAAAAVLPSATDDIIVCVGTSVTVNVNATIANVTISNGGTLQNGGGSTTNRSLTVTGILNVSAGGTLIQNSILNASTTLFAGTEVFSPTATLTVSNWSSRAVTLITGLNSNLGHVNLNWSSGVLWWDNQGLGVVKTIQGNLTIGTSCQTFLDSTGAALAISIPGNLTVNGKLRVKNGTSGNAALLVNGNASLGASGIFTGIYAGAGDFTFSVNNLVSVAGSTFNGLLDGHGNTGVSINGTFTCAGNFYGINAPAVMNNGVPDIQINSLTYNGGTFMASCTHNLGGLATVNIISHATVNFTIAADKIQLLGLSSLGGSNVTTRLNFTVGGNLTVGGLSTCELKTSEAYGEETVSVNGVFTSTAAKTLFNGGLTDASGHKVKVSLGGYVISGGTVWFSENPSDTVLITVNGNVQISGGVSILKSSTGYARMTVNGNFTQNLVGSLLYMHGPDQLGLASAANDFADIRVNGNFTQSGGILYFDNYDSPAEQRIYINGPSYTISNSATMERAGYGTSSSFARIIFEYPGTVTYFRNLAHTIQQCKQSIKSGCTVNVTSGPFQLSSHAATQLDMLTIEAGAVLSMGLHQLVSDTVHAHCGLTLQDNARLRISRTQGLYDGTANAAISSRGGMNYFLGAGSTVEYNTTTYARVTGINVGMANLPQHKYGILEINHTGAAGTWVSPTYLPGFTNAVYIRTKLIMTAGEFNLADAGGNPASGGRWVMIENPSPSALVRNGGYIRSEAMDHSARIVWTINAVAGTYLIPWGYSAAEYIPLTYQLTGGSAGTVSFSTYRTPPSNLPWPVGVNNLASHIGLTPDNRSATVDRFWRMAQTGSAPVLNLSFNYAGIELPGLPYNSPALMRAHAYNTSTNRWLAALPGQAASAYTVSVPSAGGQTHWALASMNAPLPLEWVSMQAEKDGAHVAIRWTTLSEKDCDFFTVCKSLDGINFEALTSTPASGNTGSLNAYLIYDYHAASKKGYYRIAETDLNGEVHWSEVFNYSPAEAGIDFFVWKDPVSQLHLLKFPDAEPGTLFIYHSDGRLLFSEPLVSGSPFTLPTQLKTGEAYIIRFLNPYTSYSLKCGF